MPFKQVSAIYIIVCKTNGKTYVGGTSNLKKRFLRHRTDLNNGVHKNPDLQHDWNEFGENFFHFGILENCSREELLEKECAAIKMFGSMNPEKGYNYTIPDNSVVSRLRKSSVRYNTFICINFKTKEVLEMTTAEIFEKLQFKKESVHDASSYWRGSLIAQKSYKGWIFVNKLDYKDDFNYIGFDKQRDGRLPVIKREKKIKIFIPYSERNINRKPILVINKNTLKELKFNSLSEAVKTLNLTETKVRKCLNAIYGKYSHHDFYFKRI